MISSKEIAVLGGVRGQIFEAFSLSFLSHGGNFVCRNLSTKVETEHQLNIKGITTDKYNLVFPTYPLKLWVPRASNQPAIDALSSGNSKFYGFQCTVSTAHDIIGNELVKIIKEIPSDKRFTLYFVVPEDVYDKFNKVQNYVTTKGQEFKQLNPILNRVDQYVLKIPLEINMDS